MTAIDDFFRHYYARRPVNATFTGVHQYDDRLPDWSKDGLAAADAEMAALGTQLSAEYPPPASASAFRTSPNLLDAELARGFLEIQRVENGSLHGPRGGPALWTGEAVFSIIALMIREFAPIGEQLSTAEARLAKFATFLDGIRGSRAPVPRPWKERARRDYDGTMILLTSGIIVWMAVADLPIADRERLFRTAAAGRAALTSFMAFVEQQPDATESAMSCGPDLFDLLLERGHFCTQSRVELLTEAKERFEHARASLDELARSVAGSWADARAQLAADHPTPDEYHTAFEKTWQACYELAEQSNAISWPDNWPIQYRNHHAPWTEEAAPYLYFLHYRSPAPFDAVAVHEYVVPSMPADPEEAEKLLRVWNNSTIKLNHVVHHGAIGHHVQNWYAYNQQRSRIGKVAAVDCANRIGMFCGGTMAEGWACYATDLMEELGFLTPLEQVSQQHTRVRMLARAIVDIELHQGTMSFGDVVRFYVDNVGMSADTARAEAVKNSMYPCTAIMYWLGTQGIHDLRGEMRRREGPRFSLRRFHDELLGYGSIPVPLVARMMTDTPSPR